MYSMSCVIDRACASIKVIHYVIIWEHTLSVVAVSGTKINFWVGKEGWGMDGWVKLFNSV